MRTFTLVTLLLSSTIFSNAQDNDLRQGFSHPPDSVRPWVYWMWMDGNLSRDGITADLESMKQAGIGGVIIMEVDVGVPRGPVEFMSPEWRQLFKHAVKEAERLGLQITLNAGPGWTGSGGPWVKPEQSMQHIVASETEVTGPGRFDGILPRPAASIFRRRGPPAGEGTGEERLLPRRRRPGVPDAVGNERIEDIDEKALYVRAPTHPSRA